MKCLHCEAIIPVSQLSYFVPAVYTDYIIKPQASHVCLNGHLVLVQETSKNKFMISEYGWCDQFPGRLSHIRLWVNNEWKVYNISKYQNIYELRNIYVKNQKERKYQISESRKMWLLCAKRLGLVPDVRKLIGKMMNLEPFEYWRESPGWTFSTNCLLS